jgi:hypothetical protein
VLVLRTGAYDALTTVLVPRSRCCPIQSYSTPLYFLWTSATTTSLALAPVAAGMHSAPAQDTWYKIGVVCSLIPPPPKLAERPSEAICFTNNGQSWCTDS